MVRPLAQRQSVLMGASRSYPLTSTFNAGHVPLKSPLLKLLKLPANAFGFVSEHMTTTFPGTLMGTTVRW